MIESRVCLVIGLLLVWAACSPQAAEPPRRPAPGAAAAAQTTLVARLAVAMDGHEFEPSREDLLRLADEQNLTTALLAIYEDPSEQPLRRIRALFSLRHLTTSRARAALEQAIQDPGTSDSFRRAAVKAYAAAFKTEAVGVLTGALKERDVHTREATIRSLGEIGSPQAREVLRRHLAVESEPSVRGTLQKIVTTGPR